jgi:hypothetical protein
MACPQLAVSAAIEHKLRTVNDSLSAYLYLTGVENLIAGAAGLVQP